MAEPIVTLSHIQKSFGSKEVLKDLNFTITPGSIVGYIGPNGAGKSTTVKMMLGLMQPDGGTIELLVSQSNPTTRVINGGSVMCLKVPTCLTP